MTSKRIARPVPSCPPLRALTAAALAGALLAPTTLRAQTVTGSTLGDVAGSTRAMALGDAYAMSSGHADAVFYHPALLTGASGMGLEMQRWGSNGSSMAASAAFSWLGGGVAIGLRTLEYQRTAGGGPQGLEDGLFAPGPDQASDRIATIGYAREALFGLDVGVAVDLVHERFPGDGDQKVARVDVGVAREVGPLTVGLTVADIGPEPVAGTQGEAPRFLFGAGGYGRPLGPLDVGLAAKVGLVDDEVIWGGGIEIGYWPVQGRTFVARLGFQDVPDGSEALPLTTGFAFQGDDIVVEWAFRPFSESAPEGGSHRFALRWR